MTSIAIKIPHMRGLARFRRILRRLPGWDESHRKYLLIALCVYALSSWASYLIFRVRPIHLSVRLVPVQFEKEIPQSLKISGRLKPMRALPIEASGSVRWAAKTGDSVKQGQLIGTVNEDQNRSLLEKALADFRSQAAKLKAARRAGADALAKAQAELRRSRDALESAKDLMQKSLIHSPGDGYLWIGEPISDTGANGGSTVVGQIADPSRLTVAAQVSHRRAENLPERVPLTLTKAGASPISVTADVHYLTAQTESPSQPVGIELAFPATGVPLEWLYQTVNVEVRLPPLHDVALVDPKAAVGKGKETRILLLNSAGYLRWQRIGEHEEHSGKILIRNADPRTFRVVLPKNIERIDEAIAHSVQPKVKGNAKGKS